MPCRQVPAVAGTGWRAPSIRAQAPEHLGRPGKVQPKTAGPLPEARCKCLDQLRHALPYLPARCLTSPASAGNLVEQGGDAGVGFSQALGLDGIAIDLAQGDHDPTAA